MQITNKDIIKKETRGREKYPLVVSSFLPVKSANEPIVAHQAGSYPSFYSMK